MFGCSYLHCADKVTAFKAKRKALCNLSKAKSLADPADVTKEESSRAGEERKQNEESQEEERETTVWIEERQRGEE